MSEGKVDVFIGAAIAALILLASNIVTLFSENPELTFESIKQSAWVSMVGGALVAFLKDYQAVWTRQQLSKVTKSGATHALVLLGVGALAASSLPGCSGTRAAYSAADGLYETAYVVGEHYLALQQEVNSLDDQGKLSASELQRIQDIEREARPLIVIMLDAANAYENVRSAENEEALSAAIADSAVQLSRLIDAIRAALSSASVQSCAEPVAGLCYAA